MTAGEREWAGSEEDWLGAPMWWSHADAPTYETWLRAAGLEVLERDFAPEGSDGHSVFWARRPGSS